MGGLVHVTFSQIDDQLTISVTDTGPGIASEHLPRLTERFYRIDQSRSRETGGTGLGLAITKHVMQRHGGELQIQSELGKGSTFNLIFPASRLSNHVATLLFFFEFDFLAFFFPLLNLTVFFFLLVPTFLLAKLK